MMRAPGSTVLGLVEEGQTLIEVEVETNWSPEEIKALALEEGYGVNAVNGRFQPIPKGKPKPLGIVRRSLEQEAVASIELDRDEIHVLDEHEPVEATEVTPDEAAPHGRPDEPEVPEDDEAVAEPAGETAAASSSLPETDTGTESAADAPAEPSAAPAVPEAAAATTAVPVSLNPTTAHVPNAEALLSAARATGDLVFFDAVTAIEEALTDLARRLIAYEDLSEARAEVARLEEEAARIAADLERARARAGLGTATPSPATPATPAPAAGPTQAQVRAWARANGIDVNAKGNLPTNVVLAYKAAHQAAAA